MKFALFGRKGGQKTGGMYVHNRAREAWQEVEEYSPKDAASSIRSSLAGSFS